MWSVVKMLFQRYSNDNVHIFISSSKKRDIHYFPTSGLCSSYAGFFNILQTQLKHPRPRRFALAVSSA